MKQIICRISEEAVGPLMDQFVRSIAAKAKAEDVACELMLIEHASTHDTNRCGVVAVFRKRGDKLQVLLGKRQYAPEANQWALPGGHAKEHESTEEGAKREVKEEVGVTVGELVFHKEIAGDEHDGDHATIYGTMYTGSEQAEADDETKGVKWFDVASLPDGLAFDNNKLIPEIAAKMKLSEALDVRAFILKQPTFDFKTSQFMGEQVFMRNARGSWPQPIGCVNQDPDGQWFIVSGRWGSDGKWHWWDNEFQDGEQGGVYGPRFQDQQIAAGHLWSMMKKKV